MGYLSPGEVVMFNAGLLVVVVTLVRLDYPERESTRIPQNREPIHPRLAPLKPHALRACSNFEPAALVNRGARAARWGEDS